MIPSLTCRMESSKARYLRQVWSRQGIWPRLGVRSRSVTLHWAVYLRAGTSSGLPVFFKKNTRNLAGLVLLAFRPTAWTSPVPS